MVLNVVPSGGLCLGQDPGGDGGYHGDRADDGGYRGDRGDHGDRGDRGDREDDPDGDDGGDCSDCDDGPYGDGGVDLDTDDLEGTCLGKDSKRIRLVFKGVADVLLSQAVPDCCNNSLARDYLQEGTKYRTINIFIKCFCRFKMIGGILRVLVRAVPTVVFQVAENIFRNTTLPMQLRSTIMYCLCPQITQIESLNS